MVRNQYRLWCAIFATMGNSCPKKNKKANPSVLPYKETCIFCRKARQIDFSGGLGIEALCLGLPCRDGHVVFWVTTKLHARAVCSHEPGITSAHRLKFIICTSHTLHKACVYVHRTRTGDPHSFSWPGRSARCEWKWIDGYPREMLSFQSYNSLCATYAFLLTLILLRCQVCRFWDSDHRVTDLHGVNKG